MTLESPNFKESMAAKANIWQERHHSGNHIYCVPLLSPLRSILQNPTPYCGGPGDAVNVSVP